MSHLQWVTCLPCVCVFLSWERENTWRDFQQARLQYKSNELYLIFNIFLYWKKILQLILVQRIYNVLAKTFLKHEGQMVAREVLRYHMFIVINSARSLESSLDYKRLKILNHRLVSKLQTKKLLYTDDQLSLWQYYSRTKCMYLFW